MKNFDTDQRIDNEPGCRATRASVSIVASLLCSFLLGGCGATPPPASEVPSNLEGPVRSNDAQLGAELFEQHCAGGICHGDGAGPDLTELSVTPGQVRAQVRSGRGAMPAIGPMELNDDDLEHVLAHLEQLGALAK